MRKLITVTHFTDDLGCSRVQVNRLPHSQALEELPASRTLGNLL